MLFLHWKQVRFALLPFVLVAYALPLVAVQGLGSPPGMASATLQAYSVVSTYQVWLPFYPLLAAGIGITLALSAWNWDHQLHHVYALALPIPRWRYTALKMGAGAVLALLPSAAFWVGARVATASITLPVGLNAYPNQLAIRFLVATLTAYAAFFALAAGTVRTTLWVVGAVAALVLFGGSAAQFVLPHFGIHTDLLSLVLDVMATAPGPFQVFTGSWMLIDV
jgi:hypothetical protein